MRSFTQRNYINVSAVGAVSAYPWIPVETHGSEFNIGWAAFHNGTGQVSANIEGTYVDVLSIPGSAASFFLVTANASTGLVSNGSITQPVMAVRYRVSTVSGSANVSFRVQMAS